MTALDQYQRLEAIGIWRRSQTDPGQEVIVTFGDATLTIGAMDSVGETPLAHWSLAAVRAVAQFDEETVYSPGQNSEETLSIADADMRAALSKILLTKKPAPDMPAKNSRLWTVLILLGIAIAGYLMLPNLLASVTQMVISPERARLLTSQMIPMIEERTGPACHTDTAQAALNKIAEALHPGGETSIMVMDLGDVPIISLPGSKILINQAIVEQATSPDTIVSWSAVGIASEPNSPAITGLFGEGGVSDALKFLMTGRLETPTLNRAVNRMLIGAPDVDQPILRNAAQMTANARVSLKKMENIVISEGWQVNISDLEPNQITPVLDDQAWEALRRICGT